MITSLNNSLIKDCRKLHKLRERRRQNLFLLEGTNLLEAVIAQKYVLRTVLFTENWAAKHHQLLTKLICERQELVLPEILQKVTTTINPDGVVATLDRDLIRRSPPTQPQLGIALERLQDPGNLGTIIRTATASGVDGLLLSNDCVDPENPKVLRASAGAWFQTPPIVIDNLALQLEQYRTQGVQIIATLPHATKTYWQVDWCRPSLILLGNEGSGLSSELAAYADVQVSIPMQGNLDSLNVAISCALLLYEAQRQQHAKST